MPPPVPETCISPINLPMHRAARFTQGFVQKGVMQLWQCRVSPEQCLLIVSDLNHERDLESVLEPLGENERH